MVSSLAQEVRSFLVNFFARLTLEDDVRFLPLQLAVHHDDAGALIAQFSLIDSMPLAQQGWLNSMKMRFEWKQVEKLKNAQPLIEPLAFALVQNNLL